MQPMVPRRGYEESSIAECGEISIPRFSLPPKVSREFSCHSVSPMSAAAVVADP